MVWPLEYLATCLALASTHLRSLALPDPKPFVFVGVLTDIKTNSDFEINYATLVEKNKFLFLTLLITSARPGSKTGNFDKSK